MAIQPYIAAVSTDTSNDLQHNYAHLWEYEQCRCSNTKTLYSFFLLITFVDYTTELIELSNCATQACYWDLVAIADMLLSSRTP